MVSANVNGMQKNAITKSATAKFIKNGRRSVRECRPLAKTRTTKMLPVIESKVVKIYKTINPDIDSSDKSELSLRLEFESFVVKGSVSVVILRCFQELVTMTISLRLPDMSASRSVSMDKISFIMSTHYPGSNFW